MFVLPILLPIRNNPKRRGLSHEGGCFSFRRARPKTLLQIWLIVKLIGYIDVKTSKMRDFLCPLVLGKVNRQFDFALRYAKNQKDTGTKPTP